LRTGMPRTDLYNRLLPSIEDLCRSAFTEIGSHGWEHTIRVRALCSKIGREEGTDLKVLDIAALFHDTMRLDEDHALRSAEFAFTTLSSMGFDNYFCIKVREAILPHSFSSGRPAKTAEAQVLADADRLDAMGAIGIYRTIQYNLEQGYSAERVAQHIREKLLKLEKLLYTNTAKRMVRSRTEILELYLRSLEEELFDASISK
jgi:uncharacterized protein